MTESELWNWMMDGNYPKGWPNVPREHRTATAVLTKEISVKKWHGHRKPETTEVWSAGKKVKVVMASRFGDVGITDDLSAENGYHYRTPCDEPAGLLTDIQPTSP